MTTDDLYFTTRYDFTIQRGKLTVTPAAEGYQDPVAVTPLTSTGLDAAMEAVKLDLQKRMAELVASQEKSR